KRQKREGGKYGDSNKPLFQRIWGEDDEIALLKGILEFFKRGLDPFKETDKFHDFIKKSLGIDFVPSHVKNKAVRMKKKFKKNENRKDGEAKSLTKTHEQKCFELSKEIWNEKGSNTKNNTHISGRGDKLLANLRKEVEGNKKTEKCSSKWIILPGEGIGNIVMNNGLDMVEASKQDELKRRWKEFHEKCLKLCELHYRLVADGARSILANNDQD
ncbi:Probable transcription factor At4g00390, partial [Linum perenne]